MEANTPLLVQVSDLPRYLGNIGRTSTYKLIAGGELTRVNIGRRAFVTRQSIDAYVERITAAAAEAPPPTEALIGGDANPR